MTQCQLYHGDCLEIMPTLPAQSVAMICADLPYGTTLCKWDSIIPLDLLWEQYKRLIKPQGAIVLTASQPFTTTLISSNLPWFKYTWVWNKAQSGNARGLAKYQPLKITEDVVVFSKGTHLYKPIMRQGKMRLKSGARKADPIATGLKKGISHYSDQYYPTNILYFPNCINKASKLHETQKPLELFEYLIRTYSNEGDVILDNVMGSGTTGHACANTGRNFIGIEMDAAYYGIAETRIVNAGGVR